MMDDAYREMTEGGARRSARTRSWPSSYIDPPLLIVADNEVCNAAVCIVPSTALNNGGVVVDSTDAVVFVDDGSASADQPPQVVEASPPDVVGSLPPPLLSADHPPPLRTQRSDPGPTDRTASPVYAQLTPLTPPRPPPGTADPDPEVAPPWPRVAGPECGRWIVHTGSDRSALSFRVETGRECATRPALVSRWIQLGHYTAGSHCRLSGFKARDVKSEVSVSGTAAMQIDSEILSVFCFVRYQLVTSAKEVMFSSALAAIYLSS